MSAIQLPRSTALRHGVILLPLAAVLLGVTLLVDAFTDYNIAGIAIYAIAAAGLTVLTGINGQLSLGHGALMAVGAYTTSLLLKEQPQLPFLLTLLAAIVVTGVAGGVIGIAAARLRGPYLAGATLALAVGLPQLAIHFGRVLGGNQGLNVAPPQPPATLGGDFPQERWLAWIAIAAAVITLFLLANLVRGAAGRTLRAVHDNETAARLAGIDVARVQVLAFVISAVCAGLAGSLFAYWVGITAPTGFGLQLSLQLLSAIVIGGLGSLTGAVLGAFVLVYLPVWTSGLASNLNLSSDVTNNLPLAVYGAVLVVAMLVFPRGIQGTAAAAVRAGRQRLLNRRLNQRTSEVTT
ncbi:MAG TPA: branched-chain amino acid ABC transporter permease [Candidatus Dormibacteraeota bacterium]